MTTSTRRRLLQMCASTGILPLAGCFGDDEDDRGEENGDEATESGDEVAENGDPGEDETDDETPAELDIPEPVDWTGESRATIEVGTGGEHLFEPDSVRIETGTTLRWVWMGNGHTLTPTHQPADAGFEGNETVEDGGFEVEFVPETPGEYRYVCEQHEGMVGYLVVE